MRITTSALHLSRRNALGVAGLAGVALIGQEAASQPAFAGIGTTPLPLPQRVGNSYRPTSVSDPRDLPHLPGNARLVRWRWARSANVSLQEAIATLGSNDILVLPEDEKAYLIDSSRGFGHTSRNYYSMLRTTRGIVGLGPGAVIRPSASKFRSTRQTYAGGLQEKLVESRQQGAYFGNFTMYGRDFGGVAYNALWASGANTVWERIHLRGAHRGFLSVPPGEAGGICGYKGQNMQVYNCEIDCRDESGKSVGTSPLMWNIQNGVVIKDVYAHHTYAGMPTFWRVHNAIATNLVHTDLAQGLPNSHGVNVERCSGTFKFDDCTFRVDYGPRNRGRHLNTGGQTSSIRFEVHNPTIDAGPWPGKFAIQQYSTTAQRSSDYVITKANGSSYPRHIGH